MMIKRLYVPESIHEEFLNKLVAFLKTLKVGSRRWHPPRNIL